MFVAVRVAVRVGVRVGVDEGGGGTVAVGVRDAVRVLVGVVGPCGMILNTSPARSAM